MPKKTSANTRIPVEEAIHFRSFKSKRSDGYVVKTVYVLLRSGVIHIERSFLSRTLLRGCIKIREIRGYVFQYEKMTFKLESFCHIAGEISKNFHKLDQKDLVGINDVLFDYDQAQPIKIVPPKK